MDAAQFSDRTARYFDGETAVPRQVRLRFGPILEILEGESAIAAWRYEAIRRADAGPGVLRLKSLEAPELARLDVADPILQAIVEQRCSNLGHRGVKRQEIARIVAWSLLAAASIALVAIFGVPRLADRLAPLIPAALEEKLGRAAANQVAVIFGDKVCHDPKGEAALTRLATRLAEAGDLDRPITVTVLQSKVPNAFALPGGRVYVLSGLIDKAESPDELGGVVAHELGHVAHRDGLRLMIADGGVAFLFSLLLGDVTGAGPVIFLSKSLVVSANTREAEARADAFAASALRNLGRPSAPLGRFLLRMTGEQSRGPLAYLASHPLTQDRLETLKRDDIAQSGAPLLSGEEWEAVGGMCPATASGAS